MFLSKIVGIFLTVFSLEIVNGQCSLLHKVSIFLISFTFNQIKIKVKVGRI